VRLISTSRYTHWLILLQKRQLLGDRRTPKTFSRHLIITVELQEV